MTALHRTAALIVLAMMASAQAATNLAPKFASLRSDIQALAVPQNSKTPLLSLLDDAEQHSADGQTTPFAVIELLNAFAIQSLDLILLPEGAVDPEPLISKSDEIAAILFFESGDLVGQLPALPDPPSGSCSVRIVTRLLGPALSDPGGTIFLRLGGLVQLEAEPSSPGGTFQWSAEPENGDLISYSEDDRISIRVNENRTFAVKVQYQVGDATCADVIHLQAQGNL